MELKIGDKVRHRLNPEFDMLIVGEKESIRKSEKELIDSGNKFFKCKYYNVHTNQWDEMVFWDHELLKQDES